ncbi:MAG: hypothetical protein LBE32_00235 [Burkholderiales bacterium]|nr:hypothetical protein [Burkholderiales bacterium]
MIITLLIGIALEQIPLFVNKVRLASLLTKPALEGRYKVIEHHAVTGGWIDETDPGAKFDSLFSNKRKDNLSARIGRIQQGAIHIEVVNRKRNAPSSASSEWWSLRPVVAGDDAPTISWVCGSRQPPTGVFALGEDLTTIPPDENFRLCQSR